MTVAILVSGKLQSDILPSTSPYYGTLEAWLAPLIVKQARWVRCYSALVEGWTAQTFHANCDHQGPTLTLIKVHDYMFGGFLDQNWGGKSSQNYL